MNEKSVSTSLLRGLDLLSLIARAADGMSMSEIRSRMPWPRTTTLRFLVTLQQYGLVEKSAAQYRVTSRFFDWTQRGYHDSLRTRYRGALEAIAAQVDELTFLGVVEGTNVFHVDYVQSAHAIVVDPNPLKRHSLEKTAMGKLVMGQRSDLLAAIGADAELAREVAQAVETGVAWNRGETSSDLIVVATWAASPSAISPMIGIAWPKFRFKQPSAKKALATIQQELASLNDEAKPASAKPRSRSRKMGAR